jgi:hypothetical protein
LLPDEEVFLSSSATSPIPDSNVAARGEVLGSDGMNGKSEFIQLGNSFIDHVFARAGKSHVNVV